MLQYFTPSLTHYSRLATREVRIGNLTLGNFNPVRVQTMTTTDTMDTEATVAQTIRCIEAGAELVRITAPSKKEAENLLEIKNRVRAAGFDTPLVADIHFTPNAAEIAARLIEKVRVNPGNYVDKKRFDHIEYTDAEYAQEIDRIRERFTPLVKICREYGTAMRIGTNHGSLSDRIMSRYGDTAMGMVESAMEFLRIARAENYHQIILSMKSSNPQVMVQAYRLLIRQMDLEFGECYPMHLGVTEAGDGEDGRIKSAIGIGTLLEDGIGDTIRVSLTEDPEFEIPVCRDIVDRYAKPQSCNLQIPEVIRLPYDPFSYARRLTQPAMNLGGTQVPVVVSDFSHFEAFSHQSFESIGYRYDPSLDKWQIGDQAADFVYCGAKHPGIALPGTLGVILESAVWSNSREEERCFPMFDLATYRLAADRHPALNFVMIESYSGDGGFESALLELAEDPTVVLCLYSANTNCMQTIRRAFAFLLQEKITNPVIICIKSSEKTPDTHLIHFATEAGALLLDGFGDGIMLSYHPAATLESLKTGGRTYLEVKNREQFTNNTAFSILQATRTRISKTEYISCPSCGRTLFDLQETTAKIRTATSHLKGVKIAIMGCIVNGPGEMADADFGYVGSGPGKITLYKSKEVVKRNVPSETAVDELIKLLKDNGAWTEPSLS